MQGEYNFQGSKLIQWVIKYSRGLIEDEKEAEKMILIFIGVIIIITLMILFSSGLIGKEEIAEKYKFDPTAPTWDVDKMSPEGR